MPVQRDPVVNLKAIHKRPTAFTDAMGNTIEDGDDVPVTDTKPDGSCRVGVIPSTLRRSPYVNLTGMQTGDINLRRWLVAVVGAPTVVEGDLIEVLPGQGQPGNRAPGRYRAQVVNPTPPGEIILLAQCMKDPDD